MALADGVARGIPAIAVDVGGIAESVGSAGLLVEPDALGASLRRWLTEPGLRAVLRRWAAVRRRTLPGWADTAAIVEPVLHRLAPAVSR